MYNGLNFIEEMPSKPLYNLTLFVDVGAVYSIVVEGNRTFTVSRFRSFQMTVLLLFRVERHPFTLRIRCWQRWY